MPTSALSFVRYKGSVRSEAHVFEFLEKKFIRHCMFKLYNYTIVCYPWWKVQLITYNRRTFAMLMQSNIYKLDHYKLFHYKCTSLTFYVYGVRALIRVPSPVRLPASLCTYLAFYSRNSADGVRNKSARLVALLPSSKRL